ncbi:MFS transporter [Thalassomonas haliotis]|uniref:MFS transporter n=2 Tax=Thalassomonas haliotis TaxID=485448 RepID=A0ABY7VPK4_9GAMM|nr:MFS transporter [Thalassomonas haliotis]
MPLAIWILAIGAFTICTGEFVIMGLLPDIAGDLHVDIGQSGYLVTSYALGVVLGAPLLTPFLVSVRRKPVLIYLMAAFVLGNVACAFAMTYEHMLVVRFLTALSQASFFGIGAVVATQLVSPGKQASAIGAMFLGATLANIIGSPLGTMIGQNYDWRVVFFVIAGLGFVACLALAMLLPKVKADEKVDLRQEFSALVQPAMIKALVTTILGFGGVFTVFTYIAPILTGVTGIAAEQVPLLLLVVGLGMAVGNPIGAKLADKNLATAVPMTIFSLILSLLLFYVSMSSYIAMVIASFVMGIAMFSVIPPMQMQVLSHAGKSPLMSSSFNIAALNIGSALGATVGGMMLSNNISMTYLPFMAIGISAVGLFLSCMSMGGEKSAAQTA